jgi:two-component system chemotaxis sensor kinase CheA
MKPLKDLFPNEKIGFLNPDKPREECGVFGVYGHGLDVAKLTYYGLYALQHRGQESAGIATSDGKQVYLHKDTGLVSEVFDSEKLEKLPGHIAIGHVRYSTTGSSNPINAQPLVFSYAQGAIGLAHNGNITNIKELRSQLTATGSIFQTTTDSEAIVNLIARYSQNSLEEALSKCMIDIKGAYSLVLITEESLIAMRDPYGFRPLCLGQLEQNGYVVASESCALELQEQHWLKSSVSEVTGLFQGIEDIDTLAETVINKITPLVGAVYGLFYSIEQQGENQRLMLKAAYAFESTVKAKAEMLLGESLAGQCALENRIVDIDNIPDGYIQITSGLGAAPAKSITIIPVDFEGQVLAVIELASFDSLTRIQKELLQEVRYSIGIAMNRVMSHQETKRLLNESQALTEELQSQSEELQLQSEELKTFNEMLEEQYKKSEKKTHELEQIKNVLEEKTRQLVLSSQYKSEFLSNMSHELRTPLNSLLILAQMLAENKEGNLLPFQVEYAQTIMASGQDLLNIINEVLDLAKIESGKMSIAPEKISLSEVAKSLEVQFRPVAISKGIKFEVNMKNGLVDDFYTDRNKLVQILRNLLSNAFKFTEEGIVKLIIQKIEKDKIPEELRNKFNMPLLSFMVIDSGIGINKEDQDVIFEAFQQVDGTASRKYGGTGLGLSISKELANLLGGFIHLKSEKGQGSIFTLYLPDISAERLAGSSPANSDVAALLELENGEKINYNNNQPQNQEPSDPDVLDTEYSLEGNKILVVDDDMRNIFAVTAALEAQGIEVLFAENGMQALDILQTEFDIDLVLMDIMMPEMDGYEAMEHIRKIDRYKELPIIALTAKAMKGDREKCLDAGASDYISKPLDINQLLSLIRVWLYK